jgi:two-component system, OmpR family, response regulator
MSVPPAHVLVVDDMPQGDSCAAQILKSAGFRVTTAGNASDALERMSETMPDLVLVDPRMAGTDVWELQEHLREQGCRIPVAFIPAGVVPGQSTPEAGTAEGLISVIARLAMN